MTRYLLMVSDDGQPDFIVNTSDNIENWISDGNAGLFAFICLTIGVLLGVFITYMIRVIREETYTKYCNKCNKDISDKWNYCPYCGDPTNQNNMQTNATKEE